MNISLNGPLLVRKRVLSEKAKYNTTAAVFSYYQELLSSLKPMSAVRGQ